MFTIDCYKDAVAQEAVFRTLQRSSCSGMFRDACTRLHCQVKREAWASQSKADVILPQAEHCSHTDPATQICSEPDLTTLKFPTLSCKCCNACEFAADITLKHFDGFFKDDAWVVGGMHIFVGWLSGLPCQVG